ncbi:hypothetical protein J6590_074970 [Homalodisca vitripennis]|nr:hypothetical protein J6590_074970 [Homalodisca vitripennis]
MKRYSYFQKGGESVNSEEELTGGVKQTAGGLCIWKQLIAQADFDTKPDNQPYSVTFVICVQSINN